MRRLTLTLLLAIVCVIPPAIADEIPPADPAWGGCWVAPPPPLLSGAPPPEGELEVLSGKAEFSIEGEATFSENIILRSGDRYLSAEGARYDFATQTFEATGAVRYQDDQTLVSGSGARYSRLEERANFDGADFKLWSVPARGTARDIEVTGDGKLKMHKVTYTSCPEGKDDWQLRAGRITVNESSGYGIARDVSFEIKGVPVLYLPYFTYPVTNKRKSGFLTPDLGSSQRRGVDVSAPWYWNISPNLDATLTPRLMTKRGLQMGGEFRYLAERHDGVMNVEFLPNDDVTDDDRSLLAIDHQSALPLGLRGSVRAAEVSDSNYFEDFGGSLADSSQTHLARTVDVDFYNGLWSGLLRIENYQTIDDTLTATDKPYTRAPQLAVRGYSPRGLFGLSYELIGDVTYFHRSVGVNGFRGHVMPTLSKPVDVQIFRFTPSVAMEYTHYDLNGSGPGESGSPSRSTPIASLDLSTIFERQTKTGRWLQTLEPRVLYTYIPYRNQDDLPVFDTVVPDLNIVQLYRQNRFVGYDRLGDTNQIALGLTTRLIGADDGIERMRLTMGQLQYLASRDVTLPGDAPSDSNSSDYLAELSGRVNERWRLTGGFQWNARDNETRKAEVGVIYNRDDLRLLNLNYRYTLDSLEEVDLAVAWPIGGRWNFVGRYNYSLESSAPLERFAGLEYETCCWAIRASWRRYVVGRFGESDTSWGLQVILKGLSDSGTAAKDMLGRDILGY